MRMGWMGQGGEMGWRLRSGGKSKDEGWDYGPLCTVINTNCNGYGLVSNIKYGCARWVVCDRFCIVASPMGVGPSNSSLAWQMNYYAMG